MFYSLTRSKARQRPQHSSAPLRASIPGADELHLLGCCASVPKLLGDCPSELPWAASVTTSLKTPPLGWDRELSSVSSARGVYEEGTGVLTGLSYSPASVRGCHQGKGAEGVLTWTRLLSGWRNSDRKCSPRKIIALLWVVSDRWAVPQRDCFLLIFFSR